MPSRNPISESGFQGRRQQPGPDIDDGNRRDPQGVEHLHLTVGAGKVDDFRLVGMEAIQDAGRRLGIEGAMVKAVGLEVIQ